jgi:hypothetical protein
MNGLLTLGQLGAEVAEGADFLFGGDTCDDVSGEAAHDVGLDGRQIKLTNHQTDNRGKGVAIVKAERSHFVAAATEFHRVFEWHDCQVFGFPQLASRFMAVTGGLMKCVFGLAKHGILSRHHLPGKELQPGSLRRWHQSVLFERLGFGFELLKFGYASAFQKTFARFGINRFCNEAILNRQAFFHQLPEERVLQNLGINVGFHQRMRLTVIRSKINLTVFPATFLNHQSRHESIYL